MFAARDFKEGERILERDDSRVVTPGDPLREDRGEYERHCDYLSGGKVILAGWPERHTNHSCDPNAYNKTVNGIRYFLARRNIAAGDEMTQDYCINSGGDTVWECNCGSCRCRKTIHSDFFHLPIELQMEYLPLLDGRYVQENLEKTEDLERKAQL